MHIKNSSVISIVYQNEETGYTVLRIQTPESVLPITAVGTMPSVNKGMVLTLEGTWEQHKQYGKQFAVKTFTIDKPTTRDGIVAFLTSGIIANVGPVRAEKIVDAFGTETLEILDTQPERLLEISGIGKKSVKKFIDEWKSKEHIRKLMLFFKEYDVTLGMVHKLYKKYGNEAQEKISRNPYILCEDISGIGFIKADAIAQKMGLSHDSYKRIRAGILYAMSESGQDGHICMPIDELADKTTGLLGVPVDKVHFSISHLLDIKLLVKDNGFVYLPLYYSAEQAIAHNIADRIFEAKKFGNVSFALEDWIDTYEKTNGWKCDGLQKKALHELLRSQVLLLTGGPGTGKTTVLKMVVALFEHLKKTVKLAAPTGRAAQRMYETTGRKALTIHRLLEYSPRKNDDDALFSVNEQNPLDADIVIIDEVSMIDLLLMYHLCKGVRKETRILFVGDSDQLPSVGPGNVLSDLIRSGMLPFICLTTVFRQAASSRIVSAAHEINSGVVPVFCNGKEENCFFIGEDDLEKALDLMVSLVSKRLPETYHLHPLSEIQVLSPMHKGVLGTENINRVLQNVYHQSTDTHLRGRRHTYFTGDKVLQIKNNYENNIFNGDIGFVKEIHGDEGMLVDFGGNIVAYDIDMTDDLVPGYCISIHKSQGSEFRAVVLPVSTQHFIMLQRNLIYTAITRARQICIMIGSPKALSIAVRNSKAAVRYSQLSDKIGIAAKAFG